MHYQHDPEKTAKTSEVCGDPSVHPRPVQALTDDEITIYGEGQQTRSFCCVDDLIEGFMKFMDSGPDLPGPADLGTPNEFTIRELVEHVIDLTGSKSKLKFLPLPPDDPTQRRPDIRVACERLGWEPTVQLREGPSTTIMSFDRLLSARTARQRKSTVALSA